MWESFVNIVFRPMCAGEEDEVAAMVRQLPKDLGLDVMPSLTGDHLRHARDILNVTVAACSGPLIGVCLWTINFSTWRGMKGMYVCDLFVTAPMRGYAIGEALLRAAAKEATGLGAQYIKLEVSAVNPNPTRFYQRLKFTLDETDRLMFLEPAQFNSFIVEKIR